MLSASKAITNVPIHTNGSAQMQYCAVVDEGNFVWFGRSHSTYTSPKIHLESQEAINMSKLGVISSVKYGCEISVSKFVNCKSFHRVCSIRNILLVKSMYEFTKSQPSHSHKPQHTVSTLHSRLASISGDCANIFSQEGGVDETPYLCCWSWYC